MTPIPTHIILTWSKRVLLSIIIFILGGMPMPRGRPDGDQNVYTSASNLSDYNAIYQYLWGFSPIDAQGRMYYLDTFNNGFDGFTLATSGAAKTPALNQDAGKVFSPPNCMLLDPGVASGDQSRMFRQYFLGRNLRLGMEAGFDFFDTVGNWVIKLDYKPIGGPGYTPTLNWDHSTGTWRILLPAGVNQGIYTPGIPPTGNFLLMQIKVVGDWSTGKYVRALIGDNIIDISQYNMATSAITYDGFGAAEVHMTSYGAGTVAGHLGYVLLTKDEP